MSKPTHWYAIYCKGRPPGFGSWTQFFEYEFQANEYAKDRGTYLDVEQFKVIEESRFSQAMQLLEKCLEQEHGTELWLFDEISAFLKEARDE